jgi:hypothetical protein
MTLDITMTTPLDLFRVRRFGLRADGPEAPGFSTAGAVR